MAAARCQGARVHRLRLGGPKPGSSWVPLADAIRRRAIVEAAITHADDTGLRVLDRDAEDGSVLGHMWVTLGDKRFAAFLVTKDWTAGEMKVFLGARTRGWLVCDGYAGYDQLVRDSKGVLRLAGCWAHARRYFVRAKEKGDSRAREVLARRGPAVRWWRLESWSTSGCRVLRKTPAEHARPLPPWRFDVNKNGWFILVAVIEAALAVGISPQDAQEVIGTLELFRLGLMVMYLLLDGSLGPFVFTMFSVAHIFMIFVAGPLGLVLAPALMLHGVQYGFVVWIRGPPPEADPEE